MLRILNAVLAGGMLLLSVSPTLAENWDGAVVIGGATDNATNVTCQLTVPPYTVTQPPCGPGFYLQGSDTGTTTGYPTSMPTGSTSFPGAAPGWLGLAGVYPDASSPTGYSKISGGIPLSEFARSSTVDSLATSVAGLQASMNTLGGAIAQLSATTTDFKHEMDGNLAASAALETLTPSAPGKTTMHLGYGHVGEESAVGLTFAHRLNVSVPVTVDGGFSLSSRSDATLRAGVGIEF